MAASTTNTPISIQNARSLSLDTNTGSMDNIMDEDLKKLLPSLAAEGSYKKGVGRSGGVPGYIKQEVFKEKLHQVVLAAWMLGEDVKASGSQDLYLNTGSVGQVLNLKTGTFDKPLTNQQLGADIKAWYYQTIKDNLIKGAEITDWYTSQNDMLAKQLREEAKVYGREAILNVAGLAVGKGVGKIAGKMTKSVVRNSATTLIQKDHYNTIKNVSRVVVKNKTIPVEGNMVVSMNTHTSEFWGRARYVKDLFSNPKQFLKGRKLVDSKVEVLSVNVAESTMMGTYNSTQNAIVDTLDQEHYKPLSYEATMGKPLDFCTDFIPVVGNAKAGLSAFGNTLMYYHTLKAADNVEKNDMINERSRIEFGGYIKRLLINDIKRFDATKIERLLKLYNLEGYKLMNMKG